LAAVTGKDVFVNTFLFWLFGILLPITVGWLWATCSFLKYVLTPGEWQSFWPLGETRAKFVMVGLFYLLGVSWPVPMFVYRMAQFLFRHR
jgi:hypothetical protein